MQPTVSEAEYAALPPSIQRKYFSSLERLQIAEHSAISHAAARNLHPTRSRRRSIHQPLGSCDTAQSVHNNRHRRLRKIRPRRDSSGAQLDAQWFFSLPDKVRRGFFTREEQILLASRYDTEFRDSSDSAQSGASASQKRPELVDTLWSDEELGWETEEDEDARSEVKSITFFTPSLASISTLDLRLDDFITPRESESKNSGSGIMFPTGTQPPSHGKRMSFRRTLSITGNPFVRHSTSTPPTPASPVFPLQPQYTRVRGGSIALPRSSNDTAGLPIDPTAMHYQDPEARKKLRVYLASAQKFDEAVEFGFPSTFDPVADPPVSSEPAHTTVNSRLASRDHQAFLRGDDVSFLQSDAPGDDSHQFEPASNSDDDLEEDDDLTEAEDDDPVTPKDTATDAYRAKPGSSQPHGHSFESTGPVLVSRLRPEHFAQSSACNREMTLRMTLTRPDLRADEETLYGWQRQGKHIHDPLALEELPMTDDTSGLHGVFAVKAKRRSAVNRFINLVKNR